MSDNQKIIAKIKKCFALGQSSSPHEAAVAMQRAQELMAKYGVTMEALEERGSDVVQSDGVRSSASATRTKSWELKLFRSVATTFGCELLFVRGTHRDVIKRKGLPSSAMFAKYVFVGLEEDNQLAVYTANILLKQLKSARSKFTRGLSDAMSRVRKTAEVDAYCDGWVRGASELVTPMAEARMKAAREQDAATGGSTALVVLSDEEKRANALREYMAQFNGSVKMRRNRCGSYDAREQGYTDGKRATVHNAMKSGGKTKGKIK